MRRRRNYGVVLRVFDTSEFQLRKLEGTYFPIRLSQVKGQLRDGSRIGPSRPFSRFLEYKEPTIVRG